MNSSASRAPWILLLIVATALPCAKAAPGAQNHAAASDRNRYSALCRARKDIDTCSDAVRWSPNDPALISALADGLMRAGRLPDALRDYRRAKQIDPGIAGVDEKIHLLEARSMNARAAKKPVVGRAIEQARAKRYSNVDSDMQSH